MPFGFEHKTFHHLVAGTALMPQKRLGTKLDDHVTAKRVLDGVRQGGADLVQNEILTLRTRRNLTLVTLVGSVFFAAAACVRRKTLKPEELMVMAASVKQYFSLSLLIIISAGWIWIWLRHEGVAVSINDRPISPLTKCEGGRYWDRWARIMGALAYLYKMGEEQLSTLVLYR